ESFPRLLKCCSQFRSTLGRQLHLLTKRRASNKGRFPLDDSPAASIFSRWQIKRGRVAVASAISDFRHGRAADPSPLGDSSVERAMTTSVIGDSCMERVAAASTISDSGMERVAVDSAICDSSVGRMVASSPLGTADGI
ncbi:hypothetical protein GW17_00038751, partial [Ensete ventricosum]